MRREAAMVVVILVLCTGCSFGGFVRGLVGISPAQPDVEGSATTETHLESEGAPESGESSREGAEAADESSSHNAGSAVRSGIELATNIPIPGVQQAAQMILKLLGIAGLLFGVGAATGKITERKVM